MCEVGARCPTCGRGSLIDVTTWGDLGADEQSLICNRCGHGVTVSEPAPGLIMTRQDAVVRP